MSLWIEREFVEERRRGPWEKKFGTLDETSYIIGSHISMGPWMRPWNVKVGGRHWMENQMKPVRSSQDGPLDDIIFGWHLIAP
jgi:hypothetical protein